MTVRHKMVWCDSGFWPHHYGFCPSETAWKELLKTSKRELGTYPPLEMKACTTLLRNYKNGFRVAIVTVRDFPPQVTAGLLVHEAVHVWQDLRDAIGEEKPSSEFEAYTLQNISDELFTAYRKTRAPLFTPVSPSR